jgi:hypothetical protein
MELANIQLKLLYRMDFAYNAYYHSVQKLLSSRLLHERVRIRMYKTVVLSALSSGM